ncbi:hypothetical protein [Cryobacterium psychrophilum]|uniref:Uncharacterized protein n=1 Tax=Cryobacterium psychrophilum TaxID=41988 RepID=A0A4Y8KI79_9MICO|nr:hypothetical protein [Cryobacterium psychrophilum]TDW31575.1 hypothetical protein EDD25_3396 [Cryobacterium psychrophilum]TFD75198.1 hypothetical protein E3T53_16510 [Cryobacterium psychrophilum]
MSGLSARFGEARPRGRFRPVIVTQNPLTCSPWSCDRISSLRSGTDSLTLDVIIIILDDVTGPGGVTLDVIILDDGAMAAVTFYIVILDESVAAETVTLDVLFGDVGQVVGVLSHFFIPSFGGWVSLGAITAV